VPNKLLHAARDKTRVGEHGVREHLLEDGVSVTAVYRKLGHLASGRALVSRCGHVLNTFADIVRVGLHAACPKFAYGLSLVPDVLLFHRPTAPDEA